MMPLAKAARMAEEENIILQLMIGLDDSHNSTTIRDKIIQDAKLDEIITHQRVVESQLQTQKQEAFINVIRQQNL